VTLPSCESLQRCPAMQGWPSHLASVCGTDTVLMHCLHQLPPPADPAKVGVVKTEYVPSAFETQYIDVIDKEFNDQPPTVCQVQDRYEDLVTDWVRKSDAAWEKPESMSVSDPAVLRGWAEDQKQPFSLFRSTVTLPDGSTHTSGRMIEPVAGLLRHPWSSPSGTTNRWCKGQGTGRSVYDHRYVVLDSHKDPTFHLRYPGRKVFIDLGATTFGDRPVDSRNAEIGDARTYEDMFGDMGVRFDLKMGWEVKNYKVSDFFAHAGKYAADLPARTCQLIRTAQPLHGHLDNALELLAQIWRPGDYFVFKLDIDNRPVEEAFMRMVMDKCPHVVAELIYEEHCNVPELISCCWGTVAGVRELKYGTALKRFHKLRKMGIRAHFWV